MYVCMYVCIYQRREEAPRASVRAAVPCHMIRDAPCGGEVLHACLKMSRAKRPM